ncbi:MAG: GAF domain-containing protein, partial [Chloroflexi bacterium]|nr:GAF domain-containing protein [Chloroflexota bacterium]
VQRLSAVHQIDTTIYGSLDLTVILNVLLDQLINQLGADATTVWLYDSDLRVLRFVTGRGFRKNSLSGLEERLGDGFAGRIALTRLPLVIEHLAQLGALDAGNQWAAEQFTTYHGVPLIAKGEVQGVLEVFHRRWFGPDPEWMEFLETMASQAAIAIHNAMLLENLQRSNLELELAYDTTLEGWAHALELRDRATEGHTRRVVDMMLRLASALGMSQQSLVNVRRGALLHDIGKLGIPDYILLKPASLTEEEWKIMRMHPVYAYQLLSPIPYLRLALDIPYSHHERWDGSGYPLGLRGDAIPLAARAFAVIDVWDALLSNRPYSPAWSNAQMQAYLREEAGKQFDPHVVEVFFQVLGEQK